MARSLSCAQTHSRNTHALLTHSYAFSLTHILAHILTQIFSQNTLTYTLTSMPTHLHTCMCSQCTHILTLTCILTLTSSGSHIYSYAHTFACSHTQGCVPTITCSACPHRAPLPRKSMGSPPPSSHKHPAYPSMEGREREASFPSPCSWATDTPTITTQPDSGREEEGLLVTSRSSAKKNAGEGVNKDTLGWRDTSFHFQGDSTSWIWPMLLQVV